MTIHLRKMYVDCRFGQLHLHTAFPSSGGFDELTPLLCVAPPNQSGRAFRPVLRDLGRTLTAAEANELRDRIYAGLHEGSAYEWAGR